MSLTLKKIREFTNVNEDVDPYIGMFIQPLLLLLKSLLLLFKIEKFIRVYNAMRLGEESAPSTDLPVEVATRELIQRVQELEVQVTILNGNKKTNGIRRVQGFKRQLDNVSSKENGTIGLRYRVQQWSDGPKNIEKFII